MSDLLSNLGINAKMLAAQVINFAILLLLLQKFAYKPIVKMLNRRRTDIETANRRADEMESRIKGIEEAKDAALAEARKESSELIKKAEGSAVAASERIVADAKAEAARAAVQERKKLQEEHSKLRDELKKEIGSTVVAAIEQTIGDVLDAKAKEKLLSQALEKTKK